MRFIDELSLAGKRVLLRVDYNVPFKDGKIVDVSTYDPADGVSLGVHKVTITARDNPQADMYKATKSIIPERYSDANRSNLTADIKSGENQFTFALED